MQRLKAVNKFYRRYEVDLWGKLAGQKSNKTIRLLHKIQKEKRSNSIKGTNKGVLKSGIKNNLKIKRHKIRDKKVKLVRSEKRIKKLKNKQNRRLGVIKSKSKRGKRRKKRFNPSSKRNRVRTRNSTLKRRSFLYRIDIADPQRKKARTTLSRELFLVKNKLLRFYANIKKHQLRLYANTKTFKIKFKLVRGLGNQNLAKYRSKKLFQKVIALDAFFSLVEHRLDIMLYRSNFAETIKQARQFIKHRHVLVNGDVVSHCGFILKNYNVVSLDWDTQLNIFKTLKENFSHHRVPLYPPKYIYVDYSLMQSMLISNPGISKVPFPFKIDLTKWLGLAKHLF